MEMEAMSATLLLLSIALIALIGIWKWQPILRRVPTALASHPQKRSGPKGFPPGPWAWPLIGNLHLLRKCPHRVIRDMSRRYGPIVGLRFGRHPAIAVLSPTLAKEVLMAYDKVFANRPAFKIFDVLFYPGDSGVSLTTLSPQWRNHRKLCTMSLFTSKRVQEMEHVRLQEVSHFLRAVVEESAQGQRPISIRSCMSRFSARLLMRMVQSKACFRAWGEDLPELITEVEHESSLPLIRDLIPALSFLDLWRLKRVRALHNRIDAFLDAMIANRVRALASSSRQYDDLLQSLLSHLMEPSETSNNSSGEEALTMNEVKGTLAEILGAGIHTTALTIEWGTAALLKYPRCQRRLREEMETVLGDKQGQLIDEADLSKLSYLQCFLKELARLHPMVPLLMPRMSSEECEIGGYKIPPNTLTLVDVWAIGRDESIWENALEFRPERFERKSTEMRGQHFELLPFGSGRRICAGLPVAISIVGLTLANLVHCFHLELPPGQSADTMNMEESNGLTANKAVPTLLVPKPRFSMNFSDPPPATYA